MELQQMESIVSAQDDIKKFKRVVEHLKQSGRWNDDVQQQYYKMLRSRQDFCRLRKKQKLAPLYMAGGRLARVFRSVGTKTKAQMQGWY